MTHSVTDGHFSDKVFKKLCLNLNIVRLNFMAWFSCIGQV